MDRVSLGVSKCPVCGTDYVPGEQELCPTCGWDLTSVLPLISGELSEANSSDNGTQLFWARNIWALVQERDSAVKQLEWKLADIEGQLSKVWERLERAGKDRLEGQEKVNRLLSEAQDVRKQRDRLEEIVNQDRQERQAREQQLEAQLNEVLAQLEHHPGDRSLFSEPIDQSHWNNNVMIEPSELKEMLVTLHQEISQLKQSHPGDSSPRIQELQQHLSQVESERQQLREQLSQEQEKNAYLQGKLQDLTTEVETGNQNAIAAEFEADMVNVLISSLADPSEAVQRWAYALLKRSHLPKAKMAIEDYQPYRFFRCLQVLEHQKAVRTLAIDPGGSFLVSGSNDRTVKIWEINTGNLIKTGIGHTGSAIALAISPNGELFASGSGDNTIKLWELKTGKLRFTLRGHTGWVNALAFHPKGNMLVSGGADKTIALWNLETQELIGTFYGHTSTVRSLSISPQGNMLISGGNDNMIKIRNLLTGELLHTLTEHTGSVCSIAISPDGNLLASGSNDTTLRLWNVGTGKLLYTLADHSSGVTSVSISQNNMMASTSDDGTIKIWNLEQARPIHTIPPLKTTHGNEGYMLCSAIGPTGDKIVTGFDGGKIKIWGIGDH
jgi:WD40 repeat protein